MLVAIFLGRHFIVILKLLRKVTRAIKTGQVADIRDALCSGSQ